MKSVAIVFMAACVLSVSVQASIYVDASASNTANPLGGNWYVSPAANTDNLWGMRTPFGNSDDFTLGSGRELFEATGTSSKEDAPAIVTTASGLTPGQWYEVSVIYWSNDTGSHNWCVRAGLSQTSTTLFDRTGTTGTAGTLTGKKDGTTLAELSGFLGQIAADVDGNIKVYIDDRPALSTYTRSWYDGVLLTSIPEPATCVLLGLGCLLFRRRK